jgi:hypothetical protein
LIDGLTELNDLPDSLRHVEPISRFKIELRQHLPSKYLDGALQGGEKIENLKKKKKIKITMK